MSATQVLSQPDIQYHPDHAKYKTRSQHRQKFEKLPTAVPQGFPQRLSSPLAWNGKDFEKSSDWIVELEDFQLDEIEKALQHFKCKSPAGRATWSFRTLTCHHSPQQKFRIH